METSTSKLNIPEDDDGSGFVNWIHQKARFLTKVIALIQIMYGLVMNVLVLQALLTIIIIPFQSEINIMSGADVKILLKLAGGSLFWSLFIVVGGILYVGVINMDTDLLRFWVVCNAVIMIKLYDLIFKLRNTHNFLPNGLLGGLPILGNKK
ncbi:unnamed protein product [Allacma fusca]|uniref:Transmembrane protein n=1 Tax=Allacma fusca TaxID=39272 RepID=A0A8J2L3F5_9HEXA|nr:unnamed protein product [Allacma fusca]